MKDPKTSAKQPPADEKKKDNGAAPGQAPETAAAAEQVLQDLESLRARLQAAEQTRDQYLDLAQRTRADFENYQKRMQRDLAQERRFAQAPLAADLLRAIDNLERAIAAAKAANDNSQLTQGVVMVHAQLLDVLRRHGVTPLEALGQPFDPNSHEAVMQMPSKEPPMTVVNVLEQGYMIHDRVLRLPASRSPLPRPKARNRRAAARGRGAERALPKPGVRPMPTYEYHCDACEHEFEEFQSMSEPELKKCPACSKKKLRRLFGSGAAVLFKGSGFYQTDYRSDSYQKAAKADQEAQSSGKADKNGTADGSGTAKIETTGKKKKDGTKSSKS
jgi:molecular chaperone GrpE